MKVEILLQDNCQSLLTVFQSILQVHVTVQLLSNHQPENLNVQIIAGIVEHRLSDYLLSYNSGLLLVNALSFTVRTINSYWGTQVSRVLNSGSVRLVIYSLFVFGTQETCDYDILGGGICCALFFYSFYGML